MAPRLLLTLYASSLTVMPEALPPDTHVNAAAGAGATTPGRPKEHSRSIIRTEPKHRSNAAMTGGDGTANVQAVVAPHGVRGSVAFDSVENKGSPATQLDAEGPPTMPPMPNSVGDILQSTSKQPVPAPPSLPSCFAMFGSSPVPRAAVSLLQTDNPEDAMMRAVDSIYGNNTWDGDLVSGSKIDNSRRVRQSLSAVLKKIATDKADKGESSEVSMLDLSLGDLVRTPLIWEETGRQRAGARLRYQESSAAPVSMERARIGLAHLATTASIEQAPASWAGDVSTEMAFSPVDLTRGLGGRRYDLIFTKDLLGHMSVDDALKALRTVRRSQSRYLMAATTPFLRVNDLTSYGYPSFGVARLMNLEGPPYNLGRPICYDSKDDESDRYIALWDLHNI